VRPAALVLSAVLLELGWLALWPLSFTLSHSPLFTASVLDSHPAIRQVLHAVEHVTPTFVDWTLLDPPGSEVYLAPVTALAALMLALAIVYGLALLLLDRGLGALRWMPAFVVAAALVFQLTLMGMPGLFSQDVFGYVAYGRLAAVYHLNPYVWPPSVLLNDAVLPWVADVWRDYASPYGPLWVSLQWLLARTTSGLSIADQALVYRGLASVLLLVNLGLAWRLMGRLTPLTPALRTTALAALAWNPLILFEVAGNAHSDVLMVTFCLAALLLFSARPRGVLACATLTLGVLVKYLSGLGLVWLALSSAASLTTWPRRAGRIVLLALVTLCVTLVIAAPWLELPDSLQPLVVETSDVGYVNALPHLLLSIFLPPNALDFEHPLLLGIFGVYLLWEAHRVWRNRTPAAVAGALARSTLVYVLAVSMSVQTWYLCLPVSVALTLGVRQPISLVALAYAALALPALYLNYYLRDLTPGWVFVAYALIPLLLLAKPPVRIGAAPSIPAAAPAPPASSTPSAPTRPRRQTIRRPG